ncbi:MAG: histidine phosphatase family protein [Bacteroidales bacterium]|nr:histidine phosphatase family protein [Bacteroidales bacterium]
MKKLLIMRHAKSDWSDGSVRDFDRPLNNRGKSAAPLIGKEIKKRGLTPDLIISSPALRAKMTAEAVAENSGYKKDIIWNESFYFGYTSEILQAIKDVDESKKSIMIFGHNPTWSSITEILSGKFVSMKTADVAILEYKGKWQNIKDKSCKLTIYISPKNLI